MRRALSVISLLSCAFLVAVPQTGSLPKIPLAPDTSPGLHAFFWPPDIGTLINRPEEPKPESHDPQLMAVVLVHGWKWDQSGVLSKWKPLASKLRYSGALPDASKQIYVFRYQWAQAISDNGEMLFEELRRFPEGTRIALVGHSMGGLVARDCIERHWLKKSSYNTPYLITLGTPHHGTPLPCMFWLRASSPNVANALENSWTGKKVSAFLHLSDVGTRNLAYDDFDGVMPREKGRLSTDQENDNEKYYTAQLNEAFEANSSDVCLRLLQRYALLAGYLQKIEQPESEDSFREVEEAFLSMSGRNNVAGMLVARQFKSMTSRPVEFAAIDGPVPLSSALWFRPGPAVYSFRGSLDLFSREEVQVESRDKIEKRVPGGVQWDVFPNVDHSELPTDKSVIKEVVELLKGWGSDRKAEEEKVQPPSPVSVGPSCVVVCLDRSGSMNEPSTDSRRKWDAAHDALSQLLKTLETEGRAFGTRTPADLVTFNNSVSTIPSPTTDYDGILAEVSQMSPGGGTALGDGLVVCLDRLQSSRTKVDSPVIIVLSDGAENSSSTQPTDPDLLQKARDLGARIYTIGLGDPAASEYREDVLREVSGATGGEFFTASDSYQLASVFLSARHKSVGKLLVAKQGAVRVPGRVMIASFDPSKESNAVASVRPGLAFAQEPPIDSSLLCTMNYDGGTASLIITDPAGKIVNAEYPGATLADGNPQVIVIRDPTPGTWSAEADVTTVAANGLRYDLQVSGRARSRSTGGGGGAQNDDYLPAAVGITSLFVLVLAVRLVQIRNRHRHRRR